MLYVGLVTDTGRFSYDNTTRSVVSGRRRDGRPGSEPCEIAHHVYQSRSAASLAIESRALSRLTLANNGHVAYAWVTDADFAELECSRGSREPSRRGPGIGGIEAAVFLRQHVEEVRVNLRSKTGADVGSVARHFGGGGHSAASGFTFDGDIDTLLPILLPLLPGGEQA